MTLLEHDPAACTRTPCGRCRPHVGGAPPIPPDPHQTEQPARPDRYVPLERAMKAALEAVKERGPATHDRFTAWEFNRQPPWRPEPGDDDGDELQRLGVPDHILERRIDEAVAARYRRELDTLTKRMEADSRRLVALVEVAHPPQRTEPPEACCRSCARAKLSEPIWQGRYATACRFCGEWRAAHGEWPPVAVVRWRRDHPGKKVPVSIVDAAQ